MTDYAEFFLNSNVDIVELDCLEISHSLFTQTYYCVRNAAQGVNVTHEDSSEHFYGYVPMKVSLTGPRADLDHILRVELGELGEIIPTEVDSIKSGDGFAEYPVVKYRTYRSDELDQPLYGPLMLQVKQFAFTKQGAAFEAMASSLNVSRTGERYTVPRFPMLKGFR